MTHDGEETYNKEAWIPGEMAHFEYHCWESHDSADAQLWYRSHRLAEIVREEESDAWEGSVFIERAEAGLPKAYRVRFDDGQEFVTTEDELFTDPAGFYCDPPPQQPSVMDTEDQEESTRMR